MPVSRKRKNTGTTVDSSPTTIRQYTSAPDQPPWAHSHRWSLILNAFLIAVVLVFMQNVWKVPDIFRHAPKHDRICHAPLPTPLVQDTPAANHPAIGRALQKLDAALKTRFEDGGIDSISIAVVTSLGSVYEGFWGPQRANETEESKRAITVDRHSIYRLTSVSKIFTALETMILRDRGTIGLDDAVKKFLPSFKTKPDDVHITFRQLMSHMSGLGRDLPPGDASEAWPKSLQGEGPPPINGLPFPTHEQVFDAIAHNRLISQPYTFPSYSNIGYSILGLANVAAAKAAEGKNAPSTHAELLHRDIFTPLGLNGSSFLATEVNKANIVVSSIETHESDQNYEDASNPAMGQMGSISDLVKLMQTLIDPTRPESLIPSSTVREWMRPLHSWTDDYSEVGAVWEIYPVEDSYGRKQKLYHKIGRLAGYHTAFTINPTSSFGVVLLTTGPSSEVVPLTDLTFEIMQPAFDSALEEWSRRSFAGTWRSADGQNVVMIGIERGSLFVYRYVLGGTDALRVLNGGIESKKIPLWSTGGDEFRLVVTPPSMEDHGCLFPLLFLDMYGYAKGTPVNLIRFSRLNHEIVLQLPSVDLELRRA